MTLKLSVGVRNAALNAIAGALGTLTIYTGPQPDVTSAPTGAELATFTFALPTANNGVSWLEVPHVVAAAASGIAGWARWKGDAADTWIDGPCGTSSGSGAVFILSTLTLVEGEPITLTSLRLTQPAG